MLFCEVFLKLCLSFSPRISAAACADLPSLVEDDPDCSTIFGGWSEPESGWLGFTRHRSIILRISASVVISFPAIRHTRSRPFAASRRRLEATMELSGNASRAATSSRKGVSSSTSSLSGTIIIIDVLHGGCPGARTDTVMDVLTSTWRAVSDRLKISLARRRRDFGMASTSVRYPHQTLKRASSLSLGKATTPMP